MFRSDWEIVSPSSWLADFVDEEAFFSGRDVDIFGQPTGSTTMFLVLPETVQPRRRGGRRGGPSRRQQAQPQQQPQAQKHQPMETEKPVSPSTTGETKPQSEPMEVDKTAREKLLHGDFFADLPLGARVFDTQMPTTLAPPKATTKDGYAYLTYAYSTCATLDDKGETIESTRRRYEDSAGVMKAVHRRQIGDRALEATWLKTSANDEGTHDTKVTSGDAQEFEREWRSTPFGVAEKSALAKGDKTQTELPDAPPPQEIP